MTMSQILLWAVIVFVFLELAFWLLWRRAEEKDRKKGVINLLELVSRTKSNISDLIEKSEDHAVRFELNQILKDLNEHMSWEKEQQYLDTLDD